MDASSNVIVAGWTKGDLDGQTLTGTDKNAFIVKYNSAGTKQFTKLLGVAGGDTEVAHAGAVKTDSAANIFICVTSSPSLLLLPFSSNRSPLAGRNRRQPQWGNINRHS